MTLTVQPTRSLNSKVQKIEIALFKSKMLDECQAGKAQRSNAPDSRNFSVQTSGKRMSARAGVRIPLLSENVLDAMRQNLQLTNSLILKYAWV